MKILDLKCTNEATRTVVVGEKRKSTRTRSTTFVPCIRIYKGEIPGVLGDREVKRIEYKEFPLIEYKPMLLLEA